LQCHHATKEIAIAAGVALSAMTAVPAHAYALAGLPLCDAPAHSVHDADYFMARYSRVLEAGPLSFLYEGIAMADAAGLNFDPHPASGRLGDVTFDNFQSSAGSGYLSNTHFRHK
jgi:hypothetical protein